MSDVALRACCTSAIADAVRVAGLDFRYPSPDGGGGRPLFQGFSLQVPAGGRCLLLGQNGAGKSTLLRILGGKHLVPREAVTVLGSPAFHATELVTRVVFLGGPFPFDIDMTVSEILGHRYPHEPEAPAEIRHRQEELLLLLAVDPDWHMHRLSDGQRRRVQVLLGLMRPIDVVLLDEVTADLDVLARADLLGFLRRESERRGTTVIYATHVLDGLERWATHLCFLSPAPGGAGTRLRVMAPLDQVPELAALVRSGVPAPLLQLCERWLREDKDII